VGRNVVLKLVHAHLLADSVQMRERFGREARALAQLNHPNIVQLYTFGTASDGRPYFAMEFVDGRSLTEELLRGGPLSERRALTIAADVASALAHAHQAGVIHRDIKPDNIMLSQRHGSADFITVLDFGIAKLAIEAGPKLTQTHASFGTPQYVAPEQATGQPVTAATDIYALGTMLFEMLTGQVLFQGATPFEVISQHVSAAPRPPSAVMAGISPDADAIVLRCLKKNPGDRFASATELAAALRQAAAGGVPAAVAPQASSGGTEVLSDLQFDDGPSEPDDSPPDSPVAPVVMPSKPTRLWPFMIFPVLGAMVVFVCVGTAVGLLNPLRAVKRLFASSSLPMAGELDDAIAVCVNRHASRAWNSYYRYFSWVNPAKGPTGHEDHIYGLYTLSEVDACIGAAEALKTGSPQDVAVRQFATAIATLAKQAAAAAAYYAPENWKDDGMAKGKAMHAPLTAAFEAFIAAHRKLMVLVEEQADRRDQAAVADGARNDLPNRVARLRLESRKLARAANVPWRQLVSIDRTEFEGQIDRIKRALANLQAAAADNNGEVSRLVGQGNGFVNAAIQMKRHLGARPGWSDSDRTSLDNHLTQWMVYGSPSAVLTAYNSLVTDLNQAKLAPGIEAEQVNLDEAKRR
jgi:serine/threonine-protein kinase